MIRPALKLPTDLVCTPESLDPNLETPDTSDSPEQLRSDILAHLSALGVSTNGQVGKALDKETIRAAHAHQRDLLLKREVGALRPRLERLLPYFADGKDVEPDKIQPKLIPVDAEDWTGELFRLATTLWSVPVSRGFGRRMRYLVMDRNNSKLIGVFALGDPVFNLRARDQWIRWNVQDRSERLVNVMDAYVVGAVPPYSHLLGGKLVVSLIGSREVSKDFSQRYGTMEGIISKKEKKARLVLVTVTSALGRSSLYNRLHLRAAPNPFDPSAPTLVKLERIGVTEGYGHFHLDGELFGRLRKMLIQHNHKYANGHQFGDGPNWRIRVARVGFEMLGLSPDLVRHGISREVYAMPLAENFDQVLRGEVKRAILHRPTVKEVAEAALLRWVLPRAKERPEYREINRGDYLAHLLNN